MATSRDRIAMADRIGRGIGQLFAPPDNRARMEYMLGASNVARNNADITRLNAQAALEGQQFNARHAFTPEVVQAAMAGDPQAVAAVASSGLTLGTGANDIANAFGGFTGQQMIRDAKTEGDARRGLGVMGETANIDNPMTQGHIGALFTEDRQTERERNATARYGHDASAGARRYAADRSLEGAIYGHDSKLYRAAPGEILYDPRGRIRGAGAPKPPTGGTGGGTGGTPKAGEPGGPITPTTAKQFAEAIHTALGDLDIVAGEGDDAVTIGADIPFSVVEQAGAWAARRAQETGDAASAIVEALSLLDIEEGDPGKPGGWFGWGGVDPAPATVRPSPAFLEGLGQPVQPAAPASGTLPRATNPQTGEVLVLRNGQWVPE